MEKVDSMPEKDNKIAYIFTVTLYKNKIALLAKKNLDNDKIPNIIYQKSVTLDNFRNHSKFFAILEVDKIFELIKKSCEQNYDSISIEEDILRIKLMINLMDIVTEELNFELEKIKFSNEEEVLVLKESMKNLDVEKQNLKKEIKLLNNTVEELKKEVEQKEKELHTKIEENQKERQQKEKDLQANIEQIEKDLQAKMEQKEKDLQEKMEQKEKDFQTKMEQNKKDVDDIIKKLQEQMKEVKEIEKYVKENIIIEEEEEKEKKKSSFTRKLKISSDSFNISITLLLLEEKIKIKIKEIQDNLENNPLIYENSFEFKNFRCLADYYKNKGGIDAIYEFLLKHFEGNKDQIKKMRIK